MESPFNLLKQKLYLYFDRNSWKFYLNFSKFYYNFNKTILRVHWTTFIALLAVATFYYSNSKSISLNKKSAWEGSTINLFSFPPKVKFLEKFLLSAIAVGY